MVTIGSTHSVTTNAVIIRMSSILFRANYETSRRRNSSCRQAHTRKPKWAAKECKERKEGSGGLISAGKNQAAVLHSKSARLALCSLRSLAAHFGFRIERRPCRT